MCQNCSFESKTTMGVVWGLPVNPAQLGAHLEAYVEMKPTIDTLRLCKRFGRGQEAYITKLPQELISLIELELVRNLRIHYYHSHWGDELCCLEQDCELYDHFSLEEIEEIEDQVAGGVGEVVVDWDDEGEMDRYIDLQEERVLKIMTDDDKVEKKHFMKTRHWMGRFDLYSGHFNALEPTLASDFGLHTVISHHRIPNSQRVFSSWADDSEQPAETTICYLILPSTIATEDNRGGVDTEQTNVFRDSTMSAFLDPTSLSITDKQKARFGRAMQILGLRPYIHFTQLSNTLAAVSATGSERHLLTRNPKRGNARKLSGELNYEDVLKFVAEAKERVKELETSEWPQLIVFASNHTPV